MVSWIAHLMNIQSFRVVTKFVEECALNHSCPIIPLHSGEMTHEMCPIRFSTRNGGRWRWRLQSKSSSPPPPLTPHTNIFSRFALGRSLNRIPKTEKRSLHKGKRCSNSCSYHLLTACCSISLSLFLFGWRRLEVEVELAQGETCVVRIMAYCPLA